MKRIYAVIFMLILFASAVFAAGPSIQLMYFEDLEVVVSPDETWTVDQLEVEMAIPIGSTIVTGPDGTAELQLVPNGTIIRLSANTNFQIVNLAGNGTNKTNNFKMDMGKFRAIAAAVTGDESYTIQGRSSVCGVRGTDFGMDLDEGIKKEEAFVLKGEIEYSKKDKDGNEKKIKIGKGQKANAFDDDFKPIEIPPAELVKLEDEHIFKKLKPESVKTKEPAPEPTPEPTPEPPVATIAPTPAPTEAPTQAPSAAPKKDMIPDWLKKLIGMEIGSITINDETYAKAVIQPTIALGKFKTALYLPIIYKSDMFNPADWYHPNGNDEWSFGFDQEGDILNTATDFVSDLFLKIKYIEWGKQRDNFWIKAGNLNDFTVGHGLIMDGYANDADFPAIRKVGLNIGLNPKTGIAAEAVVNNLAEPEIVGGRVALKIIPQFGIGITGIVDLDPGKGLPLVADNDIPTDISIGDPIFINAGADLDLPLIESGLLSIIGFVDGAFMLPVFKSNGTGDYSSIASGPAWSAIGTDTAIKNFGAQAGIMGNVLFVDYRVDVRYFNGAFKPAFYGSNYDRIRAQYAVDTANFVKDTASTSFPDTLGIYGMGGFTLDKICSLELAYMWPLAFDSMGGIVAAQNDEFHAKFTLSSDVIPFIKLNGSISYDRTYFAPMLLGQVLGDSTKKLGWLDEYSVLKGEFIYGVSDNLDVAALVSTAVLRDELGNPVYDDNGNQKIAPTVSIETRVHF